MLGKKVRDKFTGFTGTATARTEYASGEQDSYAVEAPLTDGDSKTHWIGAARLEVVE